MRRLRASHQRTAIPPGPTGIPFVGNMPFYNQDRLGFLLSNAKRFGDIVRFSDRIYILNSPSLIEFVLNPTNKCFRKLRNFLGEEVDEENIAEWMRGRRAVSPHIGSAFVDRHVDFMAECVLQSARNWRTGSEIDVLTELERITSRIIARFCFGKEGDSIPELARELLDSLLPVLSEPIRFPTWLPIRKHIRERKALARIREEIARILTIKNGNSNDPPHCLADCLLASYSANFLPSSLAARVLLSITLAGHAVPAAAMSWVVLMLNLRPRVRERLRIELDEVLAGRMPKAEDLRHLTYTEAIIKETLRLYPPTWMVARTVTENSMLDIYPMKPGQSLIFSSYVTGRDERYFDEPLSFKPERWFDQARTRNLPRYAYFPFGGGAHLCLGHRLASTELVLLTSIIEQTRPLQLTQPSNVRLDCRRSLIPTGLKAVVTQ
jgi:cytochrome P450